MIQEIMTGFETILKSAFFSHKFFNFLIHWENVFFLPKNSCSWDFFKISQKFFLAHVSIKQSQRPLPPLSHRRTQEKKKENSRLQHISFKCTPSSNQGSLQARWHRKLSCHLGSASHIRVPVWVLATLLLIWLPANMSGKQGVMA